MLSKRIQYKFILELGKQTFVNKKTKNSLFLVFSFMVNYSLFQLNPKIVAIGFYYVDSFFKSGNIYFFYFSSYFTLH